MRAIPWAGAAVLLIFGAVLTVAMWPFESGSHPAEPGRQLFVEVVEVDGRDVPCVVYDSNSDAGAVDCAFPPPATTDAVAVRPPAPSDPPTLDEFYDACARDPSAFRACPNYPDGGP